MDSSLIECCIEVVGALKVGSQMAFVSGPQRHQRDSPPSGNPPLVGESRELSVPRPKRAEGPFGALKGRSVDVEWGRGLSGVLLLLLGS